MVVVNPLDADRNWEEKPFGPTNYHRRPQETRSRESALKGPGGLKQMEAVIWDAGSLYKEQVKKALEAREYSPDSILGLADLVTEARTNGREAKTAKTEIEGNREMLLWALRLYDKVPDEYKQHPTKGHRSLVQASWTGERIIQLLEQNEFKFEKFFEWGGLDDHGTSSVRYDWENAARMLRIVANYLDETTRAEA